MSTAIIPIVLLLGVGVVLRRRFLTEGEFWRGIEWLSYRVFTPALFVTSIGAADLSVVPVVPLLVSVSVPIVVGSGIVLSLRRVLRAGGEQITSVLQGSVRINTYVGLIFASALHGAEGLATFALASAIVVPLVNVICVGSLVAHGSRGRGAGRPPVWRELAGNPLIQGCVVGTAIALTGVPVPEFVAATLDMLAAPALVCGTLIAGASLQFRLHRRDAVHIGAASVVKLLLLPVAALLIALQWGVSGATLASIVLVTAVPVSPSSIILASRMGGDVRLIAAITGVQTMAAMVTMPALIALVTHVSTV